jgi:hypothetical protein
MLTGNLVIYLLGLPWLAAERGADGTLGCPCDDARADGRILDVQSATPARRRRATDLSGFADYRRDVTGGDCAVEAN